MTTGQRIKKLRDELGLTQAEFAKFLYIHNTYVSMFEKDDREPSVTIGKRICRAFGVSLDWLYGLEDEPPKKQIQKIVVKTWCPECGEWHETSVDPLKACVKERVRNERNTF